MSASRVGARSEEHSGGGGGGTRDAWSLDCDGVAGASLDVGRHRDHDRVSAIEPWFRLVPGCGVASQPSLAGSEELVGPK